MPLTIPELPNAPRFILAFLLLLPFQTGHSEPPWQTLPPTPPPVPQRAYPPQQPEQVSFILFFYNYCIRCDPLDLHGRRTAVVAIEEICQPRPQQDRIVHVDE